MIVEKNRRNGGLQTKRKSKISNNLKSYGLLTHKEKRSTVNRFLKVELEKNCHKDEAESMRGIFVHKGHYPG